MADTQIQTKAPDTIQKLILGDSMKKQFALALPKVLPVDRFVRCLVTTMNRTPELANCDRQSVLAGAMTAAQLGLEIDPALGRAYLLPYRDKSKGMIAQLIIGYKGYVDLAYRSGQLSGMQAEAVYSKDEFEYEYGLIEKLRHVPSEEEDRGELKYAYAVAHLKNGGHVFRVLNRSDVMRHKKASKSAHSDYSPWNTNEAEMWRKTAIRALASMMPLSPELREAVAAEEEDYSAKAASEIADAVVLETSPLADSSPSGMASAAQTNG